MYILNVYTYYIITKLVEVHGVPRLDANTMGFSCTADFIPGNLTTSESRTQCSGITFSIVVACLVRGMQISCDTKLKRGLPGQCCGDI